MKPQLCYFYSVIILAVALMIGVGQASAQSGQRNEPVVGFQPFESQPAVPSVTGRDRATAGLATGSTSRQTYPYPAGNSSVGTFGGSGNSPQRTIMESRISGTRVPTGGLNRSTGQSTLPLTANTPNIPRVNPAGRSERPRRPAQPPFFDPRNSFSGRLTSSQSATGGQTNATGQVPAAGNNRSAATRLAGGSAVPATRSRLNQAVVQQTNSTLTGNRDTRVARASFQSGGQAASSQGSGTRGNNLAASRTDNTVAKPQSGCCCVPVGGCPTGTVPVRAFNPQAAANQIPTLGGGFNGASPNQGVLGQGGNAAATGQPGFQFQPGLGVPQFNSTGSFGNGSWFSNLVRGTGAYRPLIPLEPFYPNARLGQGIIGQPTAYVDGQPVRNLFRYFGP